jgi:hypothetical protein
VAEGEDEALGVMERVALPLALGADEALLERL